MAVVLIAALSYALVPRTSSEGEARNPELPTPALDSLGTSIVVEDTTSRPPDGGGANTLMPRDEPPPPDLTLRPPDSIATRTETPGAAMDTSAMQVAVLPDSTLPPPAAQRGQLQLILLPWANVVVDDVPVGRTPLVAPLDLDAGAHTVVLQHPDFPEVMLDVEVPPDTLVTRRVSLWSEVALLWLEINPWADVLLDDVVRDTIPPQERPLILMPGRRTLTLRHPQLGRRDTTLTVAAGDTLRLRYNLAQVPRP